MKKAVVTSSGYDPQLCRAVKDPSLGPNRTDDEVTCGEARFVAGNLDNDDATTLLRFIDQAEARQWALAKALADVSALRAAREEAVATARLHAEDHFRKESTRLAVARDRLATENAQLREACEAALECGANRDAEGLCDECMAKLREALEGER